ncbi:hypothetical protein KY284_020045 [Solanum tuberosum]|nr:hypothetical protein KY284_020045 [Solanum tuberosum]
MAMESKTQVARKQKKKGHQASLVQEASSEPNEATEGIKQYIKQSWADEVEAMQEVQRRPSIWENFDINKLCVVLGAHPPFSILNGYVQRLWGKHGINKVHMLKNGIVLVRFDSIAGKNEAIQGGIYHFDNKPFIVKVWNEDMEFTREELYTVPIWVILPGLDFKYWSPKGLSKIGSLIGKPLMVDIHTEKKL